MPIWKIDAFIDRNERANLLTTHIDLSHAKFRVRQCPRGTVLSFHDCWIFYWVSSSMSWNLVVLFLEPIYIPAWNILFQVDAKNINRKQLSAVASTTINHWVSQFFATIVLVTLYMLFTMSLTMRAYVLTSLRLLLLKAYLDTSANDFVSFEFRMIENSRMRQHKIDTSFKHRIIEMRHCLYVYNMFPYCLRKFSFYSTKFCA